MRSTKDLIDGVGQIVRRGPLTVAITAMVVGLGLTAFAIGGRMDPTTVDLVATVKALGVCVVTSAVILIVGLLGQGIGTDRDASREQLDAALMTAVKTQRCLDIISDAASRRIGSGRTA